MSIIECERHAEKRRESEDKFHVFNSLIDNSVQSKSSNHKFIFCPVQLLRPCCDKVPRLLLLKVKSNQLHDVIIRTAMTINILMICKSFAIRWICTVTECIGPATRSVCEGLVGRLAKAAVTASAVSENSIS